MRHNIHGELIENVGTVTIFPRTLLVIAPFLELIQSITYSKTWNQVILGQNQLLPFQTTLDEASYKVAYTDHTGTYKMGNNPKALYYGPSIIVNQLLRFVSNNTAANNSVKICSRKSVALASYYILTTWIFKWHIKEFFR